MVAQVSAMPAGRARGRGTCWGENGSGQATPPGGTFLTVSSGHGYTCAIKSNGAASCWGDNASGQADPLPVLYSAIDAGPDFTIGVSAGGLLFWGNW